MKTEPSVEATTSQSETQLQDTDVGPSDQIKMKLLQPHHLQGINKLNNQSLHEHQQETEIIQTNLENLYPQTWLKKEGGSDGFKQIET